MIEDIIRSINKQVIITLTNGKEKQGTIIGIDTETNLVRLKEKGGQNSSILISIIAMLEPAGVTVADRSNSVDERAARNDHDKDHDVVSFEVMQRLTKIEATIDAGIKNSALTLSSPDFSTLPNEIVQMGHYAIEMKLWGQIKNRYDYANKIGRLSPNSDDLRTIINTLVTLSEYKSMEKSGAIFSLLGYFHNLNKNKTNSIQYYLKSAVLSAKAKAWFDLAAIAHSCEEKEITCYALENLFLKVSCDDSAYENAWYKFIESVLDLSAYSSYSLLFNTSTKIPLKRESEMIFDGMCYFLHKKSFTNEAKRLISEGLHSTNMREQTIKGIQYLPQEPVATYKSFKENLLKTGFSPIKPVSTAALLKPITKQPKSNTSVLSTNTKKNALPEPISPKTGPAKAPPSRPTDSDAEFYREITRVISEERNDERGETLLREAISKNIRRQSAIRDLAMLLDRNGRTGEAIEMIEKNQTTKADQDKNLLYGFYFKAKQYEKAREILFEVLLTVSNNPEKQAMIYSNIANGYSARGIYADADQYYNKALTLSPQHYGIKRSMALSFYRRGEVENAKKLLSEIVEQHNDHSSKLLLDKILSSSGDLSQGDLDEMLLKINLNITTETLDRFVHFFLGRCNFENVDKTHLTDNVYNGTDEEKETDIKRLMNLANELKTRVAEGRSNAYLAAARILFDKDEQNDRFYRYLYRAFASKGDNAVQSRDVNLDTARAYYLAAMQIYDVLSEEELRRGEEQDANNALCRYLYTFLGRENVPTKVTGNNLNIKETCEEIFSFNNIEFNPILEGIKVAIARSPQFAGKKLIKILFGDPVQKTQSIRFFNTGPKNIHSYEEFIKKWNELANNIKVSENTLLNELAILRGFQLQEIWIEANIGRINTVMNSVLFELDKSHLRGLLSVFDLALDLCKSIDFDAKLKKYDDIKMAAERLLENIEKNPTKLSIEEVYGVVKVVLDRLENFITQLYANAKPELHFSLVLPFHQLKPDNPNQTDVQIKIENKAEGHAEQVELFLESNDEYFISSHVISKAYNTIRGKSAAIKIITLQLTEKAIQEKAFSVRVSAKFDTRQNQNFESGTYSLPVQIGQTTDFVEIKPNPYANGSSGRPVMTDDMFYGRETYLQKAYKTMVEDGISYVIYGQFRSGKSSILGHLEKKLEKNPQIIVAKVGDIGSIIGESNTPFYYRFLHTILVKLSGAIQEKIKSGILSQANFSVPSSKEFYEHPSPAEYFYELFDDLFRQKDELSDWQQARIIVSIDEFTYIYGLIVEGKLSEDFMKNWKALLAKNYFNVVLVAQDVFPKFFAKYENTFGTIFHERITYLDEKSANGLIDDPIKRLNKEESKFKENAIQKIIELTAGHPWYIQIFCNTLVNYINTDRQMYITEANIDIVKERLLRGTERKDNFRNFIENGDPSPDAIPPYDIIVVLKKIAENTKNNEYCSRNAINCTTGTSIEEILKDLDRREVIATHGEKGYKIRVGLFKEWLNENPNVWEE